MIKSELILPIRIYDNLFDQDRFNKYSGNIKNTNTDLVFPTNELPKFQFTRKSSLNTPTALFLKNICNDFIEINGNLQSVFQKQIPQNATNFSEPSSSDFYTNYPPTIGIVDNNVFPPVQSTAIFTELVCGQLINKPLDLGFAYSTNTTDFSIFINNFNHKNLFKITVEKLSLSAGSTFEIKIFNGGTAGNLLLTITAPGEYEVEFLSVAQDITVQFFTIQAGDEFAISYMQAQDLDYSNVGNGVALDQTKLKINQINNGTDIITYCGDDQIYNVPIGIYYYVIILGDEVYFSELFSVKSIKDLEEYYKIKWYNNCDINGLILYSDVSLSCDFFNLLFLQSYLFDPQYETDEEPDQNGQGDKIEGFKRWQKNITLDIKTTQFLSDALSGIFLHDNILIKEPISNYQDTSNEYIKVLSVTSDVSSVLEDKFQYVKLKIVLDDKLVKTDCCDNAAIINCPFVADYVAANTCGTYQIIISNPPAVGDGLKDCSTNELIDLDPGDIIYNSDDGFYYSFVLSSGIYVASVMPSIVNFTNDGTNYIVHGKILPYNFTTLYYYYNGDPVVIYTEHIQADAFGNYRVTFPMNLASGSTHFRIQIGQNTIGCDNGKTDYYVVI